MASDLETRIESSLEQPPEDVAEELPDLLEEVEGRQRELVEENPDVFRRVVQQMEEIDIASFVSENPETADAFQDLLWTGTEVLVENDPGIREEITADITVTFEADDCPMDGHLRVDADRKVVTGGGGTIDDPTLEITGPGDVLVGFVTGEVDPVQGFMSNEYDLDGPIQQGTQLAPVMESLAENVQDA